MQAKNDEWIDVSVLIKDNMVHWPNDPPIEIKRVSEIEKGNTYNLSSIKMGVHSGTHVDAPLHIIKNGKGISDIPFSIILGPARVIEIQDKEVIKVEELHAHAISRGERIIFKTTNSNHCWETDTFIKNFVYIPLKTAQYLVECGVMMIGVDYLSIGGYKKDGKDVHNTLLGAGIWIIEGLNLSNISSGKYELICLPLKIDKADGSPARVILRPI